MDIVSFNEAATANGRIEKFNANPDSDSGIVTVPKVIGAGESVTIPSGRVAVLPNVQVDGTLNIEGEVFIPSGGSYTDTAIESNNAVFDTLKVQGQNVSPFSGFKNHIINGGFDVWQRGNSQSTIGYGSADRWFFGVGNGLVGNLNRFEIAKTNNSAWGGATFRTNINVTTTPTKWVSLLEQKIETPFRLSGKTVTVSFYAHSVSVIGSIHVNLFSDVVKINSNNVNITVGTFTPTSGAVRYSFTYTLPVFDEKTIGASDYLALRFVVPSGFLCTDLGITGVQLEEGSVATPFEQRPYGLELSLCQRYYEILGGRTIHDIYYDGYSNTNGLIGTTIPFKATKRVRPTVTKVGTWEVVNCTQPVVGGYCEDFLQIRANIITAGSGRFSSTLNSYIEASAEL